MWQVQQSNPEGVTLPPWHVMQAAFVPGWSAPSG
jgi:hypothetical protein